MLSDRDRATFEEIHHRLVIEDPQFTESFAGKARHLGARGRGARRPVAVLIVVAVVLSVLMIVVQAAGPALFFAAVAGGLILLRRGNRAGDGRRGEQAGSAGGRPTA